VVCSVESPEEIACVVRIRKHQPDTPVLMVTSLEDPAIRALGRQMGAREVVSGRFDADETAEALLRAIQARELARDAREEGRKTARLVSDLRGLIRANRELIGTALGLLAGVDARGEFSILLVEDDLGQAARLMRSFAKAGLPPCLRSFPSAEAAMEFLRGAGEYADRARFPLPSLIISDLHLPKLSGLDFLRWLKTEPSLESIGFILYSSAEEAADIEQAYALGAQAYLVKGLSDAPLVDLVKTTFERARTFRAGNP
jgi:CheY-like chemotaxis protein